MSRSRTFAYVRGSIDPEVETMETQKAVIADYCRRIGRPIDGWYVDRAEAGTKHFLDRTAGRHLLMAATRGDHIIVARADRLSRSFARFAQALQQWNRLGVTVHLCDMPGAVLDANSGAIRWIVEVMAEFAMCDRRMVQLRSRESARQLELQGRRNSRFAPYGFRWKKQGGKTYIAKAPEEQAIICKVVGLASEGYSFDQIRQQLIELKVRNRRRRPFGPNRTSQYDHSQRLACSRADADLRLIGANQEISPPVHRKPHSSTPPILTFIGAH